MHCLAAQFGERSSSMAKYLNSWWQFIPSPPETSFTCSHCGFQTAIPTVVCPNCLCIMHMPQAVLDLVKNKEDYDE